MEVRILDPLVVIQETISSKHRRVKHSYERRDLSTKSYKDIVSDVAQTT